MPKSKAITLAHGNLRFSAIEGGNGPLVILLHGFPDTLHTWGEQMHVLAEAGYRVIAAATRGYEPQSQPEDGDYSSAALAGDVLAWIDQLGASAAHLVGHDWGASIAYTTAMAAPERLLSLTTMSVPHAGRFLAEIDKHPKQLRLSWYILFFQAPGIAEYVVKRKDFAFLRWLWKTWSPGWDFEEEEFQIVVAAFRAPGVLKSALGYYRAAVGMDSLRGRKSYDGSKPWPIEVPTLGMTGKNEGCIAAEVFSAMMREDDFPKGLQVVEVPDAGHFPHRERPEFVNALLLDWLATHDEA
ncbi:alpha/beta fold hydrolase [Congregibacter litoralis]|uniref:Putative hydrolase or acyltransferase (Alpha/beta hydrolase superfamily) n=1 Tax=Congregibacter litoralis KT71 TaxID=314285 RepID=A4A9U6_9GAMM|nr:alpha/beta hydrolase [Congregibacter litoralis]EAQ97263.1 putative hydrolase or acyltransferase (alpha/beta hydrolase superfamily) [Congregibacter litoralis KT71]